MKRILSIPGASRWTLLMAALASPAFCQVAEVPCPWLTGTMARHYRAFLRQAHPERRALARSSLAELLRLKEEACRDLTAERRAELGERIFDRHSGRIGLALPLTGVHRHRGESVREGLMKTLPEALKGRWVVRDTGGTFEGLMRALGDLRVKDNVALWVAAGPTDHMAHVVDWADRLRMPAIVLTHEAVPVHRSRYALRLFPQQKRLTAALAQAAHLRRFRRISFLRPADGKRDHFLRLLAHHLKKKSIEVAGVAEYLPDNFASMEAATRKLFGIDPEKRADEYAKLLQESKQRAERTGEKWDRRQVILPPLVETDAIVIPDDFRMVRHFAKLFRFHGVRRIPLLGTPQWRSPALHEPPDPLLRGAMFVDFLGPYHELPGPVALTDRQGFAPPEEARRLDWRMLGVRLAQIAAAADPLRDVPRRGLPERLLKLVPPPAPFFGMARAFDRDRSSPWPAFVFTLAPKAMKVAAYGPYLPERAPATAGEESATSLRREEAETL